MVQHHCAAGGRLLGLPCAAAKWNKTNACFDGFLHQRNYIFVTLRVYHHIRNPRKFAKPKPIDFLAGVAMAMEHSGLVICGELNTKALDRLHEFI